MAAGDITIETTVSVISKQEHGFDLWIESPIEDGSSRQFLGWRACWGEAVMAVRRFRDECDDRSIEAALDYFRPGYRVRA